LLANPCDPRRFMGPKIFTKVPKIMINSVFSSLKESRFAPHYKLACQLFKRFEELIQLVKKDLSEFERHNDDAPYLTPAEKALGFKAMSSKTRKQLAEAVQARLRTKPQASKITRFT
jgi:hypothetical protein